MSKRFTDTELWGKEFFLKYSMKQKLLLRYLYDSCDNAGIYEPNYILLEVFIGEKVTEEEILSLNTDKVRIEKLKNGKFYLNKFIKFQQGNFLNPKNNAHKQILQLIRENGINFKDVLGAEEEQISPNEAPSKPLNSPCGAPNKPLASPPSNSNSLGNGLGRYTDNLNNSFKEKKEKEKKDFSEVQPQQQALEKEKNKKISESKQFGHTTSPKPTKNVAQVFICDNFSIDFNDEFFKPYDKSDAELRQDLNCWLTKNKLNQFVDKTFICRLIINFAKKQGKYSTLLGIDATN